MFTKDEEVSLSNIADGAAIEQFAYEWALLLENVLDPNTEPEAKREVTLKFSVKPDENRDIGDTEIACTSKLAGQKPVKTKIIIGKAAGKKAEARELATAQRELFKDPDKVIPIEGKEVSE